MGADLAVTADTGIWRNPPRLVNQDVRGLPTKVPLWSLRFRLSQRRSAAIMPTAWRII